MTLMAPCTLSGFPEPSSETRESRRFGHSSGQSELAISETTLAYTNERRVIGPAEAPVAFNVRMLDGSCDSGRIVQKKQLVGCDLSSEVMKRMFRRDI